MIEFVSFLALLLTQSISVVLFFSSWLSLEMICRLASMNNDYLKMHLEWEPAISPA